MKYPSLRYNANALILTFLHTDSSTHSLTHSFTHSLTHSQGTEEVESGALLSTEDAADVAESRRLQREAEEREEQARRSTVLKVCPQDPYCATLLQPS